MSRAPDRQEEPIASIGAIAVAPSNPKVIYIGTGEAARVNAMLRQAKTKARPGGGQ